MSNAQYKRDEAADHNARYEAQRYREQHKLPDWTDVTQSITRSRRADLSEVVDVKLTEPTESKVTEQQAVGRAERKPGDVVVVGAGQTGLGRAADRMARHAVLAAAAKKIAFATPELLGEMGREQAREDIAIISSGEDLADAKRLAATLSLAGGKYGKGF